MNRIGTASTINFSQLGDGAHRPVIVDLMARALANPGLLSLAAGFTDNEVLPHELVAQVAGELAQPEIGGAGDPLQYGQNQGRQRLRELTCDWLGGHPGERVERLSAEEAFMTNGSQQALYLAMQTLCDRGDIVLVEEPSYFVCLEMMRGLGIRPIGIPCDDCGAIEFDGLRDLLGKLDEAGERERVKAIYMVSYFGNPSSRSMAWGEKEAVAGVLLEAGYLIPVIEDAAYRELYFVEPHFVPSVLSLEVYEPFPRLYLGTYTKPFATGLKVGYGYCTHAKWREKMLCLKGHQDFGSAHFNQAIIEEVLGRGLYSQHLDLIHPHYMRKAEVMDSALHEGGLIEAGWRWEKPAGGLIFWLRGPKGLDTRMGSAFCQSCIDSGVLYVPGDLCFPAGGRLNCVRLSTGSLPVGRLREAVQRFAAVVEGG